MTEADVRVFLVDFQVPEVVFFLVVVIVVPVLTGQAVESSLKPGRELTRAQLPTGRLPYQRRLTGRKEELCVHVRAPRTSRELRAPVRPGSRKRDESILDAREWEWAGISPCSGSVRGRSPVKCMHSGGCRVLPRNWKILGIRQNREN